MKQIALLLLLISQLFGNICIANNKDYEIILDEGFELYKLEKFDEATSKANYLIEEYSKKSESSPELKEYVSAALALKGSIYSKKANSENDKSHYIDAISCYDILLNLYQGTNDKFLDFYLAHSLFNKGQILELLDYKEAAYETYSKLIDNYRSSSNLYVQKNVASAMINKAGLLSEQKLIVQSNLTYQSVIEYIEKMQSGNLQNHAAIASLMICNNHYIQFEFIKEFNCYMQLVSKFKSYSDNQIKEIVNIAKKNIHFSKSLEDRQLESIKIGTEEFLDRFHTF